MIVLPVLHGHVHTKGREVMQRVMRKFHLLCTYTKRQNLDCNGMTSFDLCLLSRLATETSSSSLFLVPLPPPLDCLKRYQATIPVSDDKLNKALFQVIGVICNYLSWSACVRPVRVCQ